MRTPDLDPPPQVTLRLFPELQEAAGALVADVTQQLAASLDHQHRATLVVSGGRTPVAFLDQLAESPLPWHRVDVVLADERCVPADSDQRNSRLVREHLLRQEAAWARLHELARSRPADPDREAQLASVRVADLNWPASVVVLGMGQDGHTASLFPDAPELAVATAEDPGQGVVAIRPPSQPQARVTLTRALLSGAELMALQVRGEDKKAVLEEAFRRPGEVTAMPIRLFFRQPLRIYWSP